MGTKWLMSGGLAAALVLAPLSAQAQQGTSGQGGAAQTQSSDGTQGSGTTRTESGTAGQAQSGSGTQGDAGSANSGTSQTHGTTGTAGTTVAGQASAARQQASAGDRAFVQQMLLANMAEVRLGQLGTERATNPEVKSFAEMMVRDHSQANQQLMGLAQQFGIEMPTELDPKHRSIAERLSTLQGERFDREFMNAMVDAHREVVTQATPIARTAGTSGDVAAGMTAHPPSAPGTTPASESTGSSGATGADVAMGTSGTGSLGSGATGAGVGTGRGAASTARDQGAHPSVGHGTAHGSAGTGVAAPKTVPEYAAKTLPVVQHHLQQAQQLQQRLR